MFTVNYLIRFLTLIAHSKNIISYRNLFYCETVHTTLLHMLSFQRTRNSSLYRVLLIIIPTPNTVEGCSVGVFLKETH